MDHSEAVRLKATERYLLNELDPEQLDQFEEHLFDCPECALDLRAGAMLVEQSKTILSETSSSAPVKAAAPAPKPWLAWFRPAFAVPVMALLVAVVAYQNLVVYPGMKQAANTAYLFPATSINVATRSAAIPVVRSKSGEPFLLLVNLPTENRFSSYIADLYDSAGHIKWSVPISAETANDTVPLRIPGLHDPGTYALAVRGVGQNQTDLTEIGRQPFELRFQ